MPKQRLDQLLVERGLAPSRARAQSMIHAGIVLVNGAQALKASSNVDTAAVLGLAAEDHPFVSRGGLKLQGALEEFGIDPAGLVVADIGASTGGFTDCVLRRGAQRVYAIDVGHGQLHASLAGDPRVVSIEGVNARALDAQSLPEPVQLVLVDASFIGLAKLLPALCTLLVPHGRLLALVKPQFELGPERVGRSGVVRSDELREVALAEVIAAGLALGLTCDGHADCCLPGPEGNRELFALFTLAR
jgi:23S rRNA (cytidine1920-2'-O)/16S rRNA (cytidine1409-2'-O)-methyltransferase